MESSSKEVTSVKTWLSGLSETTQRLLLAGLLVDGQPQPAKAAGVLRLLRELVEARGAQLLCERLSYHVLRSLCATLGLALSGPATKDECVEQFVAFVTLKGLRFTLAQLGVEDLDVLSEVLVPTRTSASNTPADTAGAARTTTTPTARAGQRSHIYSTVTELNLRSWLDSLSPELATRVAFDLGKEVAEEERTLTDSILLSPRKHQFALASAADETVTSSTSDGESDDLELVVEVLAPKKTKTKTTKKAKAKETTPKKTTGKRRKSAPAKTSKTVSKRRRTSCDAVAVTDDDADEGQEVEDEHLASCHPEIAELFSAIGLKPYIAACANKGITPERLIAMTEAELNVELGMGRRDVRRINTHLHTIRERLEKKAHQDCDQPTASGAATPSGSQASPRRTKKLRELIAESNKWARRALHRDRREHHAIRDMLPSLRKMPATSGSAQATPASVGASGDAASLASEPQPTTQPAQAQEEPELLIQSQEQPTQEEPQRLKKVKQEREDGDTHVDDLDDGHSVFCYDDSDIIYMDSCEVSLLVPDDDDPPSEEY